MSEQYFTKAPQSSHQIQEYQAQISGHSLILQTDRGVFSKDRLDLGSQLLAESFITHWPELAKVSILELGSGYGPISLGIAKTYPLAQVDGLEINERAYELSLRNAQNNRLSNVSFKLGDASEINIQGTYDYVLTNPPIRAGKGVIQAFVRNAYHALKEGGELWLVIQKKQGAPSMQTFMEETFGNQEKVNHKKGYWILRSKK